MMRLALKMLMGDRSRYLTLVIGLSLVSFLFVQQGAAFCGIMARISKPIEAVGAPVWVSDTFEINDRLARVVGVALLGMKCVVTGGDYWATHSSSWTSPE